MSWGSAQQGVSGLWFKAQVDSSGRRHLLVADSRSGVDGGSHDHYWENADGTYGVQLKDRSGTATITDSKGHIYSHNSTFPPMVSRYLKELFDTYC